MYTDPQQLVLGILNGDTGKPVLPRSRDLSEPVNVDTGKAKSCRRGHDLSEPVNVYYTQATKLGPGGQVACKVCAVEARAARASGPLVCIDGHDLSVLENVKRVKDGNLSCAVCHAALLQRNRERERNRERRTRKAERRRKVVAKRVARAEQRQARHEAERARLLSMTKEERKAEEEAKRLAKLERQRVHKLGLQKKREETARRRAKHEANYARKHDPELQRAKREQEWEAERKREAERQLRPDNLARLMQENPGASGAHRGTKSQHNIATGGAAREPEDTFPRTRDGKAHPVAVRKIQEDAA